ncbi:bifunctional MaoC family dehydratase N-terminal/OB-fold nucleic acid binding domain-containing protein [Streptomyces flavofungini]|uniref:bifunctional MaoC family dehydratase N-terminal/OB-fold nucleic acid binding domain-containing protein n=1 Tax=Streptomyces flavofungini TaxID=68200 RepID=UPI0025B17B18|nr:bifunctional MaoC family dehydratase N-terminal/OB-fold nucleic acid binding domain-containing protein [Streptomyces flavofungini]WJV47630.1 bifunctional MaoC family dehydratase N-terminal/OB-fold nucleic acid binding domain-containing protein [Streptomyces flavofungini]
MTRGADAGGPDGPDGPGGPGGHEPDELYEKLKAYEGRAAAVAGHGKDPVNEPMIRHWCEAMGDTHAAYAGPEAVAPPTMLQVWTMGGLSGHSGRSEAYDELFALLDDAGYASVVATDCEQEYLRPLRPGDEITFDAVIESISERKTTKLGTGYFVTTRMDVRADGEPAGTHRFRILKYVPARRRASSADAAGSAGAAGREAVAPARSRRPRPVINRDNAGFWEGVSRHRLLIQRCGSCARLRFPWLPGCNACGSPEWDTVEASGEGTVYSYVVMHHPPFPAFTAPEQATAGTGPYAVVLVELAEGVRIISQVVGVEHERVRIGMPVRLEFQRVDEELELPLFRPLAQVGDAQVGDAPDGDSGVVPAGAAVRGREGVR